MRLPVKSEAFLSQTLSRGWEVQTASLDIIPSDGKKAVDVRRALYNLSRAMGKDSGVCFECLFFTHSLARLEKAHSAKTYQVWTKWKLQVTRPKPHSSWLELHYSNWSNCSTCLIIRARQQQPGPEKSQPSLKGEVAQGARLLLCFLTHFLFCFK